MAGEDQAQDRWAIRELIEAWVVWRDSGNWERLRSCWHDDGRMMATWFQGTADEFIEICRDGFSRGLRGWHLLGGMAIELQGRRAVAQTKVTLAHRSAVAGVLCDVVCTGRFYDMLEKRDGRWGLVLRQPVYEKDRIDSVDPAAHVELEQDLLLQFPEGYRHLAYVQTKAGYDVNRNLPGLNGPEIDALCRQGAGWLRGEALMWPAR
jgi:hypothetical protein